MQNIIEFRGVTKVYHLKRQVVTAVENISFSIEKGSFVALTGVSGSGKSTILQMMSGIEEPTSGHVLVNGEDVEELSGSERASLRSSEIGIVFQSFYLDPNLTLRQNIELTAMFAKTPKKIRRQRTEALTKATDLFRHLDHRPSELSGGQIQRVAILRAIYNNPNIILADEPTSNIDQKNAKIVLDMLDSLKRQMGATIIVATHDETVLSYADKVIELEDGRVA